MGLGGSNRTGSGLVQFGTDDFWSSFPLKSSEFSFFSSSVTFSVILLKVRMDSSGSEHKARPSLSPGPRTRSKAGSQSSRASVRLAGSSSTSGS